MRKVYNAVIISLSCVLVYLLLNNYTNLLKSKEQLQREQLNRQSQTLNELLRERELMIEAIYERKAEIDKELEGVDITSHKGFKENEELIKEMLELGSLLNELEENRRTGDDWDDIDPPAPPI